ncbi:MAG TPA: hemolysin family protein, partial [Baekduia sp.]|nr:hemolysin family protein [Baekduia sp.]
AGSRRARIALHLMEDPVRVISSVQVGITALGILTGAVGEPLVRDVLGDGMPGWLAFVLAFGIVTFLSVVLGELVPKALTLDRAETLALLVAPAIDVQARLLRPAVWVLQGASTLVLRPFGVGEVVAGDTIRSTEELRSLVDEAEEGGIIPADQERLLHNVIDFAARDVRDALVPAAEVAWLDADASLAEALDQVAADRHTRHPVGRGSLDRLAGVVHVQDLLDGVRSAAHTTVGELARPALVVPESKDLRSLLAELRAQRQQLAVVVEEYGGVAGIVTLEDVVEQLVGDIRDEYDAPGSGIERLPDGSLRLPGATPISAVADRLGLDPSREGPRTVGGLAFEALGRGPQVGDRVHVDGLELVVEALEGARIVQVLARRSLPRRSSTRFPGAATVPA